MVSNKPLTFHYKEGIAHLGKLAIDALADKYGTPLYILDKQTIASQSKSFLETLKRDYPQKSEVLYAGKANLTLGIAQLMKQLGMSIDVSSGGELFTALKETLNAILL